MQLALLQLLKFFYTGRRTGSALRDSPATSNPTTYSVAIVEYHLNHIKVLFLQVSLSTSILLSNDYCTSTIYLCHCSIRASQLFVQEGPYNVVREIRIHSALLLISDITDRLHVSLTFGLLKVRYREPVTVQWPRYSLLPA